VAPTSLAPRDVDLDRVDLRICLPLVGAHLGCLLVAVSGVSAVALGAAAASYALRAFGISAGYHRLLAHGAFRTGRATRFVLVFLGAAAAQLGPLWWVGHHRLHHRFADREGDPHSPVLRGRGWAHLGWLLVHRHREVPWDRVRDLARAPELVWLERWPLVAPAVWAGAAFALGALLARLAPGYGADGLQLLAWGFFVPTVALYHVTFAVNSLAHGPGPHSGAEGGESRNVPWLVPLTLGDAWHRNHHRFPASARHGMAPGERDPCYAVLVALERLGLVRDLRKPPAAARRVASAQPSPKRSPSRA
jgi:stearoyl-CoA desaturase (delta-9 desaturase)